MCERWLDFQNFLTDMGERPAGMTLDRRDNDGHYEPGNCRWATSEEQGNNTSRNVHITHNGKTQTASQWSRELGITPSSLFKRLAKHGTIEPTQRRQA